MAVTSSAPSATVRSPLYVACTRSPRPRPGRAGRRVDPSQREPHVTLNPVPARPVATVALGAVSGRPCLASFASAFGHRGPGTGQQHPCALVTGRVARPAAGSWAAGAAPPGLVALTMAPWRPSPTWWVKVTETPAKPAAARPCSYSVAARVPAMQPT